jgi:DNA-binding IclR family transcriptional regulator
LEVTCFIAIMGNKGPTILRFEEPGLPVTINVRVGSVLPVLWSATGRVFLSYLDDISIRSEAEKELAQATEEQRLSLQKSDPIGGLREAVRAAGSAPIEDTLLKGISAVAAPIFDHTGKVCAVLTALGAASAFDTSAGGPVTVAVTREASDISAALGYTARAA